MTNLKERLKNCKSSNPFTLCEICNEHIYKNNMGEHTKRCKHLQKMNKLMHEKREDERVRQRKAKHKAAGTLYDCPRCGEIMEVNEQGKDRCGCC